MDFQKLNSIASETPLTRRQERLRLKKERRRIRRAIRMTKLKIVRAEKARIRSILRKERKRLRALKNLERRNKRKLANAEKQRQLAVLKQAKARIKKYEEETRRMQSKKPKANKVALHSRHSGSTPRERERQVPTTTTIVDSGGIHVSSGSVTVEYFREDTYPGSCQCKHWKALGQCTHYIVSYNPLYHVSVTPGFSPWFVQSFEGFITTEPSLFPYLKWEKLLSSSQSNLIMLFAELDETLSLFSLKTYQKFFEFIEDNGRRRFSNVKTIPAFIEWGLLPFLGELQKIGRTVENLYAQVHPYAFRDTVNFSKENDFVEGGDAYTVKFRATGSIGVKGVVSIGDTNSLSVILDRLGLHPDLQTAWDLIPWSFLLDDIVQVSNALDCLWPRGWVSSLPFYGWASLKLKVDYEFLLRSPHTYGPPQLGYTGSFDYYLRWRYSGRPLEKLPPLATNPELLKAPSMRTICNILYAIVLSFNL